MSKSLGPDQDRHSVRPDLSSNFLHRLSADDKSRGEHGKSKARLFSFIAFGAWLIILLAILAFPKNQYIFPLKCQIKHLIS